MTTEPTTDRAAARDLAADAIRAAACPGNDCPLSEADCSEQRIQPAAWERGVLSEVYGRPEWFADAVLAVLPDPTDRAAVLREAAAAIEAEQAREEATAWAQSDEPDPEIEQWGAAVRASAALLRRLAAEAPTTTKPETAEDPARIDRLRPEFTEHSSVEAIDAQLRRSRAQERRWHIRTEWLISLRQTRIGQKERGEWPAAGVGQDGAQQ